VHLMSSKPFRLQCLCQCVLQCYMFVVLHDKSSFVASELEVFYFTQPLSAMQEMLGQKLGATLNRKFTSTKLGTSSVNTWQFWRSLSSEFCTDRHGEDGLAEIPTRPPGIYDK